VYGLKPLKTVFYFGAKPSSSKQKMLQIKTASQVYDRTTNCGVARTDAKGHAVFYIQCPQIYYNESTQRIHTRHIHVTYALDAEKEDNKVRWSHTAFTTIPLFIELTKKQFLAAVKQHTHLIIDTLPAHIHDMKSIPGSISMPVDEVSSWSEETLKKKILDSYSYLIGIKSGNKKEWKHTPLILYDLNKESQCRLWVKEWLETHGMMNVWSFPDGLVLEP